MTDVTNSNFNELLPEIKEKIKEASFIAILGTETYVAVHGGDQLHRAIDSEFTGLSTSDVNDGSLFDSAADRYKKLRTNVQNIITCQIGVSTFSKLKHQNKFEACTYNFYIYPRSSILYDKRFLCQASSFEFLCQHGFDFNKFIYDGISFVNEEEASKLIEHIDKDDITSFSSRNVGQWMEEQCSIVSHWLSMASTGDEMDLDLSSTNLSDFDGEFLKMELRQRYKEVDILSVKQSHIVLKKSAKECNSASTVVPFEHILNNVIGFTVVFRAIVDAKKPIIGHNLLMDLMLFFNQFYKPLPHSYKEYKRDLHSLIPVIYDTKHISIVNRKKLNGIVDTALGQLSKSLDSLRVVFSPVIVRSEEFNKHSNTHDLHEAGYDAFLTGKVFLQMAYVIGSSDLSSKEKRPLTVSEMFNGLSSSINRLNVIRAGIHNVNLAGPDPRSERPRCLLVELKPPRCGVGRRCSPTLIAKLFSRYGSCDVQMLSPRKALVAVGNKHCYGDILKAFRHDANFKVTPYSLLYHCDWVRAIVGSGIVVTSCCGLCLLYYVFR